MALFKKKVEQTQQGGNKSVVGFTKQKRFLFIKIKSKPVYGQQTPLQQAAPQQIQPQQQPQQQTVHAQQPAASPIKKIIKSNAFSTSTSKPSRFHLYEAKLIEKYKGLDIALRDQGIKSNVFDFVKKMIINALLVSTIIAIVIAIVLLHEGISIVATVIVAAIIEYVSYIVFLNNFINFPIAKGKNVGKEIERDILFAARDMVISMRSGMPLYNAMVTVTAGYGAASKEFGKVVELIHFGNVPIEQAIEEVSSKSESSTFKRIMLQASASIKAGADVIAALQDTIADVTQERVIDLRRYGQRLNALAMFYMLFGVIFPSMGIAVGIILTTFISLFSINFSVLIGVLVGIFFLQIIFLNIMRGSRPTFAM